MKFTVLGIDASTTTIGLAILEFEDKNISIKYLNYFKPPKKGHILKRLQTTQKFIAEFAKKHNPDYIAIEDFLFFVKGRSNAKTIVALASINRVISLEIFNITNKIVEAVSVKEIRNEIGKIINLKNPKKEDMPDILAQLLQIDFPYKYKKNRKGLEEKILENYDMADALAVAYTYMKRVEQEKLLGESNSNE